MIACSTVDRSTGGCHRGGRRGSPPFGTARRWWPPMLSPHGKILDRCSRPSCVALPTLPASRPCSGRHKRPLQHASLAWRGLLGQPRDHFLTERKGGTRRFCSWVSGARPGAPQRHPQADTPRTGLPPRQCSGAKVWGRAAWRPWRWTRPIRQGIGGLARGEAAREKPGGRDCRQDCQRSAVIAPISSVAPSLQCRSSNTSTRGRSTVRTSTASANSRSMRSRVVPPARRARASKASGGTSAGRWSSQLGAYYWNTRTRGTPAGPRPNRPRASSRGR
jgi:hypothetical protein